MSTTDSSMNDTDEREAPPEPGQYRMPEVEALLDRIGDLIDQARPMPLSTSAMINKDEVLDLLSEVTERLPEELRAARWLLKEREEFLARVRREGDDILDEARAQAERMVQRTEVVKAAETTARQLVDRAEDKARRTRLEVEDYCDAKLGGFESVLDKLSDQVAEARERLAAEATPRRPEDDPADPEMEQFAPQGGGFFDQDAD